jgi:hypothetical protein
MYVVGAAASGIPQEDELIDALRAGLTAKVLAKALRPAMDPGGPVALAGVAIALEDGSQLFASPKADRDHLTVGIILGAVGAVLFMVGATALHIRKGRRPPSPSASKNPATATGQEKRSRSFFPSPGAATGQKNRNRSFFFHSKPPPPPPRPAVSKTFSDSTGGSPNEKAQKKSVEAMFRDVQEVGPHPPPAVDDTLDDFGGGNDVYDGVAASEFSFNDIGGDHSRLMNNANPENSFLADNDRSLFASVGARMRWAMNGNAGVGARAENDTNALQEDNGSAGGVEGADEFALGGISEENSSDVMSTPGRTPQKSKGKDMVDFSALWTTRIGDDDSSRPGYAPPAANNLEDSVMGVSLEATNATLGRLKKEKSPLTIGINLD